MFSKKRSGFNKVANGTSNRNFARLISCLYYRRDWKGVAYIPRRTTLHGYAATLFKRYTARTTTLVHRSMIRKRYNDARLGTRLGQRCVNGAAPSPLARFPSPLGCGKRRTRVSEGSTRGWRERERAETVKGNDTCANSRARITHYDVVGVEASRRQNFHAFGDAWRSERRAGSRSLHINGSISVKRYLYNRNDFDRPSPR